jgi:hypothetical protein
MISSGIVSTEVSQISDMLLAVNSHFLIVSLKRSLWVRKQNLVGGIVIPASGGQDSWLSNSSYVRSRNCPLAHAVCRYDDGCGLMIGSHRVRGCGLVIVSYRVGGDGEGSVICHVHDDGEERVVFHAHVLPVGVLDSRFLVKVNTARCKIVTSAVVMNRRRRDGFCPCDGYLLRFHM